MNKDCKLYLAPMAGITDAPYRKLCKEYGADVTYTEMVSAKALHYKNENTFDLLRHDPEEEPLLVQLFGSEPEILAAQAHAIESMFQGIDLNFGCPAPKVVKNHEGSYLMNEPDLIYRIVASIRDAVSIPVSVKIRKGFYDGEETAVRAAKAAERGGASMVAVHGRTTAQMYRGKADLTTIARVKQAVTIPVIGNGDITDAESAIRMLEETECDGLMIGRATRGNPWIFNEVHKALRGEMPDPAPTPWERIDLMLRHAEMLVVEKGEYTGMSQMRSHSGHYVRGLRDSAHLRGQLTKVSSLEDMKALVLAYKSHIQGENV